MLEEQLRQMIALLQGNSAMALGGTGLVAALFFFKPREMFKLFLFSLFIMVIFYFITLFAGTVSSGSKQKGKMIYKSKDLIGE
jgi:hypothetical protein